MIKINCESDSTLKLTDMVPFQGNMRKATPQEIRKYKTYLRNHIDLVYTLGKKAFNMDFSGHDFEYRKATQSSGTHSDSQLMRYFE